MAPSSKSRSKASDETPRKSAGTRTGVAMSAPSARADSAHRWTFFTNHAHVLLILAQEPSIVLREVAVRVGITERAVQRIIADLEEDSFIEREKIGRKNHYRVLRKKSLRHPIEAHRTIGDLIALISQIP